MYNGLREWYRCERIYNVFGFKEYAEGEKQSLRKKKRYKKDAKGRKHYKNEHLQIDAMTKICNSAQLVSSQVDLLPRFDSLWLVEPILIAKNCGF